MLPRLIAVPLAIAAVLATTSGVVLWAQGTDHGTWAAIHTDSVIALGIVVLVHLAVYLRKAVRASAKSLAATAVNRPEKVIVWALVVALAAGALATGLEPTWNPSAPHAPAAAAQPIGCVYRRFVVGVVPPTTSNTSHIDAYVPALREQLVVRARLHHLRRCAAR